MMPGKQLREYVRLVAGGKNIPNGKADMAAVFQRNFLERLDHFWKKLSPIEQTAIAEAIYIDEIFSEVFLEAKLGEVPQTLNWEPVWGGSTPPIFRLFVYTFRSYDRSYVVPLEIASTLRAFVQKPAAFSLGSTADLPTQYEYKRPKLEVYERGMPFASSGTAHMLTGGSNSQRGTDFPPLIRRDMESNAQLDLQEVMRLIAKGKTSVGERRGMISAASARAIAAVLQEGDFYEVTGNKDKGRKEIGVIRAFAWPLILQESKLIEVVGASLAISKAGQDALLKPAAEVLKDLWLRWRVSDYDEFRRIDTIKRRSGSDVHGFNSVITRRLSIIRTLRDCPVNRWIKFMDFSRFMRASNFHFQLTSSPDDLYISDERYGSLSHRAAIWPLLEGRYLLCFLFEYASTLGLIDVAYIRPEHAEIDFDDYANRGSMEFLSRYDGLKYFRINPFGAYCLGITNVYESSAPHKGRLSVLPSMRINIIDGAIPVGAELLLDKFAMREDSNVWRIDRSKTVASIEAGQDVAEFEKFLQSYDDQPLPETVEAFLRTANRHAHALAVKGTALIIECADAEIADAIAAHNCTKDLCQRAGVKNLIVPTALEDLFRKGVHVLGYGIDRKSTRRG